MKHIKITFALIFLAMAGVQAQSCYQTGLDEGKVLYGEALRLKNSNRCDEAAQQFWAALRRFRLTRRCADLPMNHELDAHEDNCINGITGCGWTIRSGATPTNDVIERQELRASPQSLTVSDESGESLINITTNVADWRVSQAPSWLTAVKQGNN